MAQVINTNVAGLFASAALNRSNKALQTATNRLSSGLRINTAADDPSGLVDAAGFESTARGATVAVRSATNAITAAQTNDGILATMYDIAQKLREIAVINDGTATGSEASALQSEITRLTGLLTTATAGVVVEADGGTIATTGTSIASLGTLTVTAIDGYITSSIAAERAEYGADIARFSAAQQQLEFQAVNAWQQYSAVMDTDYAYETAQATKNQILQQAGMASLAQANSNLSNVLTLLR
jgi:flagellin